MEKDQRVFNLTNGSFAVTDQQKYATANEAQWAILNC
jgi:hypothetical protein